MLTFKLLNEFMPTRLIYSYRPLLCIGIAYHVNIHPFYLSFICIKSYFVFLKIITAKAYINCYKNFF